MPEVLTREKLRFLIDELPVEGSQVFPLVRLTSLRTLQILGFLQVSEWQLKVSKDLLRGMGGLQNELKQTSWTTQCLKS